MKVARQLAKVFWFPLLCAVVWTWYRTPSSIVTAVANFGPSFFLASWMTGQVFRVSKQVKTEGSLRNVEQRMLALTVDLENRTERLVSLVTGGRTYALVRLMRGQGDYHPSFYCVGDSPLYGLNVRIVDLDEFDKELREGDVTLGTRSERIITIGDLSPAVGIMRNDVFPFKGHVQRYNCFFHARNGQWAQEIVLYTNDQTGNLQAHRVTRGDDVLDLQLPDTFPRDLIPENWNIHSDA